MCKASSWRLELRPLSPTSHKYLILVKWLSHQGYAMIGSQFKKIIRKCFYLWCFKFITLCKLFDSFLLLCVCLRAKRSAALHHNIKFTTEGCGLVVLGEAQRCPECEVLGSSLNMNELGVPPLTRASPRPRPKAPTTKNIYPLQTKAPIPL